ncbi:MAG: hypothetical protein RRY36_05285 [Bacteroidaceae bacterium]
MGEKVKKREIEFGELLIRVTPDLIDIETKNKDWKIQVSNRTKEYGFISYLINKNDMHALETQIVAMYYTRMVATDGEFLKIFMNLCHEYIKTKNPSEISEKEDAVILAEEKVMALKTPEAIEELEKLKKGTNE